MFQLLFLGLLAIRFWQLGLKPVHHDEAINGWFVTQVWQNGAFHYDPSNYHGPLLFYLFQAAEAFGGWGVETLRFVTVLFSAAIAIWMVRWARSRFNLAGWWSLGLLLSPGFLFFSRSAIHESAFVFFTVMATTAWIDVWCLNRPAQIKYFLYGLTGALLLKETFVFPLAIGGLVSLPVLFKRDIWAGLVRQRANFFFHFGICILLWAVFYSGFGKYPEGLLDFFRAFLPWTKTGVEGHGHEKPFDYFWMLFWKNELATLFALVLVALGLAEKNWVRGVCLWALGICAAYSLVPYKTPWCILSLQIPVWLAAVCVLGESKFVTRITGHFAFLVLGLCAIPLWSQLNFSPLGEPHPYVYVQGTLEGQKFVNGLLRQAKEKPATRAARVQWGTQEPWPFPWWLGIYTNQGSIPSTRSIDGSADLLVIDAVEQARVENEIHGEFWRTTFTVRDARAPATAYLRKSVFDCPVASCEEYQR